MKKAILLFAAILMIACSKEETRTYKVGVQPKCELRENGNTYHPVGDITYYEVNKETFEDVIDRVTYHYAYEGDCVDLSFRDINGNEIGHWNSDPNSKTVYYATHSKE